MTADPTAEALEHFQAGRNVEAAQICLDILASDPDNPEINQLLGVIRCHQGMLADAAALLKRAAASPDATAEMHNNLGVVLYQLGQPEEAIAAYNRALALSPEYPEALNNLGVAYRHTQRTGAAIAAFKKAVTLRADMLEAKANLRMAYRDVVPFWHFAMMSDTRRNTAYDAAIRRVAPGKRVLEVGTGAGLLAMMAARAGAKAIVTCERERLIADRAREIVARNGFAEQVKIICKYSTELEIGVDLPERAEVLITEIFGNSLIGEEILPVLEHAHQHLLTPDATVIPAFGSVMGYLAGGDVLQGALFVDHVAGFDLSSFNDFAPPTLTAWLRNIPHDVLSDATELLRFDFRQASFPAQKLANWLVATKPGLCVGIVQWIRIELDSQACYENCPAPGQGDDKQVWAHVVHSFPRPVRVEPGDVVPIVVRHDRRKVNIDLAE